MSGTYTIDVGGNRAEVTRLSIPGYNCVHCGSEIGKDVVCPGCGWVDPATNRPKEATDEA